MATPPFKHLDGLVGREAEARLLEAAYQRVLRSPRSCEVVAVHGASGTGKTALVQHTFQHQRQRGTMISGKFDIIHVAPRPYSAIADALTQLCQPTTWNNISNMEEFRAITSKKFSTCDLKSLSNLVPAVGHRLAGLDADSDTRESDMESTSEHFSNDGTFAFARFTEVVRSFLYVVARLMPSPLILFLDDIQAADNESLSLISSLSSMHSESCNIVLVLGYRDPVDKDHEVELSTILFETTVFRITFIQLGNLDESKVNKLISKLLRMNENETVPLSRLIAQRTGGNIYFSLQFLDMFKSEQLLKYSFAVCRWEWDLEKLRAETSVTENVAFLLTSKILQLPLSVQQVLQLAACLGFYFDTEVLERMATKGRADIVGVQTEQAFDELGAKAPAAALMSADDFHEAIADAIEENLIDRAGNTTKCKFTHDRVLQAAYEMIPSGKEREKLHWRIGQVLWTEVQQKKSQNHDPSQPSDDWLLFAAADQLNRGSENGGMASDDVVSPLALARLNLEAGKSAFEKSAFKHAAEFFNKGVEIMSGMWQSEYSLCLELHTFSAETEYAASNFTQCDRRIDEILVHGRCLEDKLPAYLVKVQSQGVRGKILEAMDESVAVLRVLGERIPRRPNILQVLVELSKTKRVLKKTNIADFVSLPDMTDPMKIWATKFLQNLTLYSWYAGQNATVVVTACRMARLTAKFGVSSQGPFVLATYGFTLGFLGELTAAYEVGRVTMELAKRPQTKPCYARTVATVYTCLNHLKEPVIRNLDQYMDGYNTGIKSGEIDGAAMCLSMYGLLGIFLGKNLKVVLTEMDGFHQTYCDDIESNCAMMCVLPWHQWVLNMLGRSLDPLKLTGEILCEESYLMEVRRTGNEMAKATFNVARMMLTYIMCEVEAASKEVANLDMNVVSKGTHLVTPFLLTFAALTMLGMARETRRRRYMRRAKRFIGIMKTFAKAGNLNMPPLLELVTAEQKSLQRRCPPVEVKKAYEDAVRMASRSGFSVFEAIGNERAGEYMKSIGDNFWAETYLARAFLLFDEWGATTKTLNLVERHHFLVDSEHMSSHNNVRISMRKRYTYKAFNERRRLSTL